MKSLFVSVVLFFLVSAVPCLAQTSAAPASVSIKTDFVLMRSGDVDTSHVNFDTLSTAVLPNQSPVVPEQAVLQYAIGYPVTLLHQKLIQKTPVTEITETLFSPPAVSTPNNVSVKISFDEIVPPLQPDVTIAFPSSLPHVRRVFQLQGSLTLTPHINPNKSITLSLSLPSDPNAPQTAQRQVLLRPVASGDVIMMRNFYPLPVAAFASSFTGLLFSQWTLLIFVTPTLAVQNK